MTRYEIAVEKQLEALRASELFTQNPSLRQGESVVGRINIADDILVLRRAIPMYWSEKCVDAVVSNMQSFNLHEIDVVRELVPFDFGWMWFEKEPFRIEVPSSQLEKYKALAGKEDVTIPVNAMSFAWARARDGQECLFITVWCTVPPLKMVPTSTIWVTSIAGQKVSDCPEVQSGDSEATRREIYIAKQFLVAAFTFMRQKLLITEETKLERHARKRVMKEGGSPVIQVVYMRRTSREGHPVDTPEGTLRKYDKWQWKVDGHTRQQWYSTLQKHLPIFISPYWKGPENAPVKPRTEKIVVVTR